MLKQIGFIGSFLTFLSCGAVDQHSSINSESKSEINCRDKGFIFIGTKLIANLYSSEGNSVKLFNSNFGKLNYGAPGRLEGSLQLKSVSKCIAPLNCSASDYKKGASPLGQQTILEFLDINQQSHVWLTFHGNTNKTVSLADKISATFLSEKNGEKTKLECTKLW